MVFLASRHLLAEELEVCSYGILIEIPHCRQNLTPLHIVAQLFCLECCHKFVGPIEKFGLTNNYLLQILALNTASIGNLFHIKMRITGVKLL